MPSDAVDVAVAKAVTAYLAAAELSQEFTPERSYADWHLELKDSDTLHVDVVIVSTKIKTELAARSTKIVYRVPVDIAVRKRFGRDVEDEDTGRIPVEEVDALKLLVQEIHEALTQQRLADFPAGVWQNTEIVVNPAHALLLKMRQFVGIVRVTFRAEHAL